MVWERVGIDDSFFALGGDSIMSIQLVSRARKAGLLITPRAVFEQQTVAGLAGVATVVEDTASALPDVVSGSLPATPIMRWLQERGGPIAQFNQAMLLRVPAGLRGDHLLAALQAVLDHHDGLRLRWSGSAASDDGSSRLLRLEWCGLGTACGECSEVDVAGLRTCIAEQAQGL